MGEFSTKFCANTSVNVVRVPKSACRQHWLLHTKSEFYQQLQCSGESTGGIREHQTPNSILLLPTKELQSVLCWQELAIYEGQERKEARDTQLWLFLMLRWPHLLLCRETENQDYPTAVLRPQWRWNGTFISVRSHMKNSFQLKKKVFSETFLQAKTVPYCFSQCLLLAIKCLRNISCSDLHKRIMKLQYLLTSMNLAKNKFNTWLIQWYCL